MNLTVQNQEIQMTSLDFLNNYINPAREAAGEKPVKPTDFFNRVVNECDLGDSEIFSIPHPQNHKPQKCVNLNYDQLMLVGMRESKAVRKAVLAKLKELQKPKLPSSTGNPYLDALLETQSQVNELKLHQSNTKEQVKSIGSDVADIKTKVDKIKDLSEQLDFGHVTLKDGWAKYCNVCSYDVFREFASVLGLPLKPFNHVPDGTVVIVKTHQVKISDLQKMRDHIVKYAIQKSSTLWEHPDLNHKFKLRIK